MSVWDAVADEGTSPDLLAAVVDRCVLPGERTAVLRQASAHAQEHPHATATSLVSAVVEPVLVASGKAVAHAETWRRLGIRVALVGDPGYPARLAQGWPATGGPLWLARRGAPWDAFRPTVAIIGARKATGYGTGVAAWLAAAAADAGAIVISGGALGIDAAAHGGAAHAGTVVVLGCGHDVDYPAPHARSGGLFERVLAGGGALLSEQLPSARPAAFAVRARNRIVAGLADVVVVVEGGGRSGTLVTAGYAADLGVPVLAVPGDVREPLSVAPHRLLAEGAAPCTSPADLLDALGATAPTPATPTDGRADDRGSGRASTLPPEVRAELARRWPRPVRLDDLATASGVPVGRLLAQLTRARVSGEVAEGADGVRLTRAPA